MSLENEDIRFMLVVGIAAMLLLFISLLLIFIFTQRKRLQYQQSLRDLQDRQQRQLIEAAVRSEETERHRIAEELHDEVGALLSSTKLYIYSIKNKHTEDDDKGLYRKCTTLLDEAIIKVRGISHNLHSSILQEFGLNEAIKHFALKISNGTHLELSTNLDYSYVTQESTNDINIYRIIQELVNNTLKHAQANKICIRSKYENNLLIFSILHNGKGITQHDFESLRYNKEGLGLKNIQNRIILLKGELNYSQDSAGFKIELTVPRN